MKRQFNLPSALAALGTAPILLFGTLAGHLHAQTALVDWGHTWNYMHPTAGVLPAGSGATEPNSGPTKWYAPEADFAASYAGPSFTTGVAGSFDAGAGPAPIAYGAIDYTANPLPPPAEFPGIATTLTTPANTARYTGYFRTTFDVPNDGNFYVNPVIRYILDDGGFVYLDGELVLRVNMATAAADNYLTFAANTTATESHIRDADITLPVNSSTGGNTAVTPAIAGNAVVIKRLTSLAAGTHTLAVAVHNQAVGSSDITLAVQLKATATSCAISAAAGASTRDGNGTPADANDDKINFSVNVTSTGTVSPAGWKVTGPAGSAAMDLTGAYNTNVSIANIPIAEFASGSLSLTIADADNPACAATVPVKPQRIIASDDHAGTNLPIVTTGSIPATGWVFDDSARTMKMNNGGGGSRLVVNSELIDLSTVPAVQFSGVLEVNDTSSGNEPADSFVAYLIIDGNTAAPINLITPYDVLAPADGLLTGAELTPATPGPPPVTGLGNFIHNLSYVIPASANSVQIVIEGINDSPNENFIVRDVKISGAPPTLQAIAGAVTVNNRNTTDPADDTFGAPVTINAINLSPSTGWTSDTPPNAGLYTDPQPVIFQNYPLSGGPKTFTLTDAGNNAITSTVTLTPPATTLTLSVPANIVRHENGPGIADDTVTFDVTVTGANGGPGWATSTPGVTPASGNFGTVAFTIAAPLPASPASVMIGDVSYPAVTQAASVAIPTRGVIGQRDFGGGLVDVATPLGTIPAAEYLIDSTLRKIEINNAGTPEKLLESEVLNLTAVGAVQFTATLQATDTSTGSNFEDIDKFKAELIYNVGGVPATINLVTPFDVGNGASAVTVGPNGAPDGYLNGYAGVAGTNLVNGTVYAAAINDYDDNRSRDEFNKNLQGAAESVDATFNLSAMIPAEADDVKLKLYVISLGAAAASEHLFITNVLFSTTLGPVDSDNDGMTDDYEDANGLAKNDPSDKNLDLDGDGQTNYQEFLAGTAANNSRSTLRITDAQRNGNIASVRWTSVPGKNYRIEVSPNLTNWQILPGVVPAAAAPATETSSPNIDLSLLGNPIPARYSLRVRVQ